MATDEEAGNHWASGENARLYGVFAREYPMYLQTSRDLVALAHPSSDAVVVDLACGTGVTTEAILAVLGPTGRVVGVDGSEAMLKVARSAVSDPRVTWMSARAENLHQHVAAPVDAVVCNSAIWLTDIAATAVAVRAVLRPGGRFVFTVSHRVLGRAVDPTQPRCARPSLIAVMQAIAVLDHDWMPPDDVDLWNRRRQLTEESICQLLPSAGFEIEEVQQLRYERSPEEERAWLSIPIFTAIPLPGMSYERQIAVLEKAYQHCHPTESTTWRGSAFAAVATNAPGGSATTHPERS